MVANSVKVDLETISNTCFVVMPFHALFEAEYERVIRPAIEEAGLTCVRGDEIYTQQAIIHDIWKSIRSARLVVAELSGRNPNVMYEIGLAHAIGKPIVLLTRNQEDVPFDLKALRYLFYDTNNPDWGLNLRLQLTQKVRNVLDTPALAAHLAGIEIATELPAPPETSVARLDTTRPVPDLSGVWRASWLSVRRQRPHDAILVILPEHGSEFTANMIVNYVRENVRTIVQETLTGTIRDQGLSLTGVSYTFVQQGSARSYGLDAFELAVSDDVQAMSGVVRLSHGTSQIVFQRLPRLPIANETRR